MIYSDIKGTVSFNTVLTLSITKYASKKKIIGTKTRKSGDCTKTF